MDLLLETGIQLKNCCITDWSALLGKVGGDPLELSENEKVLTPKGSVT